MLKRHALALRSITSPTLALTLACSNSGTELSSAVGQGDRGDSAIVDGSAPVLIELRLSGSSTPEASLGELVPQFSRDVHDYYVRCSVGTNTFTVSMAASPGSSSLLIAPATSPTHPKQTLSLNLQENQALVAVATDGTATSEYWVRCLPHDFPLMQMTTHPEAGSATPGYYLVGNINAEIGEAGYAMVLDSNAVPVWYARSPGGVGVCDVENLTGGAISFIPTGSPSGLSALPFEVRQLDPLSTSNEAPTGIQDDIHELRVLPNGHYLVFTDFVKTGVDLTGLHLPLSEGLMKPLGPNTNIAESEIVEFDPMTGAVVWQWFASDHFDPAEDCTFPESWAGLDGVAEVVQPFHDNSIDVDPANGNLLVSARDMDSIFYIEKSSGKVLWKMGGAQESKDGATYVPVADPYHRQHDARLQPGWSSTCNGGTGQISLFDDETGEIGPARAVVYDVTVGGGGGTGDGGTTGQPGCRNDGTVGAATVAWQFLGTSSVTVTGSFRISADGSRVIDWGSGTAARGLVFTESNAAGNDLLDFYFTDGNTSFRAIKLPLSALDLATLRSTAGLP